MKKILEGIRVIDTTSFFSGPYCTMLLADLGAEVIRIEEPGGNWDREQALAPTGNITLFYMNYFRNKKGITLKLMSSQGQQLLKELVKRSDIVVLNFRPPEMKRMGLDYDALKEIKPDIILVAISGFGQYGPYTERGAYDAMCQAMAGNISVSGFPGNPPVRGIVAHVDWGAGVHAALAAVSALFHKQRTGIGQMVDVAMMDVALMPMSHFLTEHALGVPRSQTGNDSNFTFGGGFKTKDGWIIMHAIGPGFRRLMKLIGRADLIDDPRFKDDGTRYQNRQILFPIVGEWTEKRTAAEAVTLLSEAGITSGKIYSLDEVLEDPHFKVRENPMEVEYPGIGKTRVAGFPLKFSKTPTTLESFAAGVGKHNEEIYCGLLGYSQDKVAKLKTEGII